MSTYRVMEASRISPLAGRPAPREMLIDPARLEREYFEHHPDLGDPEQMVQFGTSGHRGSPSLSNFTESHILATTQAICDYRAAHGTDGPLYMGMDTHAISAAAQRTALEVPAANGIETIIQQDDGVTPTPVISRAILVYNRGRAHHFADGIVITPSHNSPEDANATRGWFETLPEPQRQAVWAYLRRAPGECREVAHELMRLVWRSPAALAMAPVQDLLNLGSRARMNIPGQAGGNWRWRMTNDMPLPAAFEWLGGLTKDANRVAADSPALQETEVTR